MILSELKTLLREHTGRHFRLRLPDGAGVPLSFHVTEVGRVQKTFIDCGGTLRETVTCQLQVWVGKDDEHRIEAAKMAAILDKAQSFLPDDCVPVEVEYEDTVISQYPMDTHEITDDAVILTLRTKHTECLAPELCGLPSLTRLPGLPSAKSCGPAGCC